MPYPSIAVHYPSIAVPYPSIVVPYPSIAVPYPSIAVPYPEHRRALSKHRRALPEHRRALPEHRRALPEHRRALPEHRRALPEHAGFVSKSVGVGTISKGALGGPDSSSDDGKSIGIKRLSHSVGRKPQCWMVPDLVQALRIAQCSKVSHRMSIERRPRCRHRLFAIAGYGKC